MVDPVAVSKHGDSLLSAGALEAIKRALLPLATVVTPNLYEAELLTGEQIDRRGRHAPGRRGAGRAGPAVDRGQGRPPARPPVDLLFDGEDVTRFPAARIDSVHTHGTGCTLASAIASYLAHGMAVPAAVEAAKEYVTGAIANGFPLGAGIGPVDHGWRIRQPAAR